MPVRQSTVLRFLALLLGAFLLALIGASTYLAKKVDRLMPEHLARVIDYTTDGLYHLERGRIRTFPLGRRVEISDVRIVLDSVRFRQLVACDSVPDRLFSIQMKKLVVTGIRWEDLFLRKMLFCKETELEGLTVRVETGLGKTPFRLRKPQNKFHLSGATVENLQAAKMDFSLLHHNGPDIIRASSRNGLLQGTALRWSPDAPPAFATLNLTLGETALQLPHTRNQYSAAGWQYDFEEKVFRMMGFRFRQWLPDSVMATHHNLDIGLIEAHGFRKMASPNGDFFALQSLRLFEPRVVAAITRRPNGVFPQTRKDFPQKLLQKAGLPLLLEDVQIVRGAVTYEETREATGRTGAVLFDNLSGNMAPVCLAPLPAGIHPKPMRIALSGQFQNRSLIAVSGQFDLQDSAQNFRLSGKISRLSGEQISDLAANLGHLRIQRLDMDSLLFGCVGNARVFQSTLQLAYHNLAVQLMRYDTTQKRLRRQPVLSLLANELLLHPDNPLPGGPMRIVRTSYLRPETQPFFSALWRALFAGIKETAIADPALLRYLQEKAATRQERIEKRLRRQEDRRRRREERRAGRMVF